MMKQISIRRHGVFAVLTAVFLLGLVVDAFLARANDTAATPVTGAANITAP